MRQGNREDIDFKAERIEDHIFAMKKGIVVTEQKINIQNSQI